MAKNTNAGQRYLAKIRKDITTGHPLLVPYHLKRSGKRLDAIKKELLKKAAEDEIKKINSIFGDAKNRKELKIILGKKEFNNVEHEFVQRHQHIDALKALEKLKKKLNYENIETLVNDVKKRILKGKYSHLGIVREKFIDAFFDAALKHGTKFKTNEEKRLYEKLWIKFNSRGNFRSELSGYPELGKAYLDIPERLRPSAIAMISEQFKNANIAHDYTREVGHGREKVKLSSESYVQNIATNSARAYEKIIERINRRETLKGEKWTQKPGDVLKHTQRICGRINEIVKKGTAEKMGTGGMAELSDLLRKLREATAYSVEKNLFGSDQKPAKIFFKIINKVVNTDAITNRPKSVASINLYRNGIIENSLKFQAQQNILNKLERESNYEKRDLMKLEINRIRRSGIPIVKDTPPLLTWTPKKKNKKK